jgi:aryl sulfotransferase
MKNLYWLASYPKSGNTWLRILLDNLSRPTPETFTVNDLSAILTSTDRRHFDNSTLLSSGLLDVHQIEDLRPKVHVEFAQLDHHAAPHSVGHPPGDGEFPQFAKVHDAYRYLSDGTPLLGRARAAKGAIYIVRDPRGVAPSYAHHINVDLDEAIADMANSEMVHRDFKDYQRRHLPIIYSDWSGHVASWLEQTDLPVHLIRYEDMMSDTVSVLRKLLEFLDCQCSEEQICRAVEASRFETLQAQERKSGFREAPNPTFFRRGLVDGWRDELTKAQIRDIECQHAKMMVQLGYVPLNTDI